MRKFFVKTNGFNMVVCKQGGGDHYVCFDGNSQGKFEGVDLYAENDNHELDINGIISKLKAIEFDEDHVFNSEYPEYSFQELQNDPNNEIIEF